MRTSFAKQTTHGAVEICRARRRDHPAFDSCSARILTDGSVVLLVGTQSHGQGAGDGTVAVAAQERALGREFGGNPQDEIPEKCHNDII
jgi:hypothetical protein